MAELLIKYGSFSQRSGTGTQSITGVGFQPTGLYIWGNHLGADFTRTSACTWRVGISDGTRHFSHATNSGKVTAGAAERSEIAIAKTKCFLAASTEAGAGLTAAVIGYGVIDSFDVDGFTANFEFNQGGLCTGATWCYLAIGGAATCYANAAAYASNNGTLTVTGIPFAPVALIGWRMVNTTGPTIGSGATANLGFATACDLQQWAMTSGQAGITISPNPSLNKSAQQSGIFSANVNTSGTITGTTTITAFTADGFTAPYTNAAGLTQCYLAIGGCAANLAIFDQKTTTGRQSVTIGAALPRGILIAGFNQAASSVGVADFLATIGGADRIDQGSTWTGDLDGQVSPYKADYAVDATHAIHAYTPTGNFASTRNTTGAITELSHGEVTLNWTVVDGVARQWAALVLADEIGTGVCGVIAEPPTPADNPCQMETPLYWAAVQPSAELGDVLQGAQTPLRDPIDYYGGYKPPLILSIGNITRAASDYLTGFLPAQSASVVWADTRRFVRNIFGTVRSDFTSSPIWIYLISNAQRLVQGIPRLIFYGFLAEDPASQDLTYTTNANDLVGKDYSLLGDEVLIPKQIISTDEFPDCPDATLGGGVPIIGGTVSNADLSDASVYGAIKLIDVGDYVCQDAVTRRALLVSGHACQSVTLFQAGAEITTFGIHAWAPGETGWTDIVPGGEAYVTINSKWFTLVFVAGKRAKAIDPDTAAYEIATVASATSNVSFTVGSGEAAQFTVGDDIDIRLAANSNTPELRRISTIATNTITVTEALSGTPAAGDTVQPSALTIPDGYDGSVYADVEGMTDISDGSGALMEDLILLDRHILENFILGDYTDGNWLDTPTFEFYPGGSTSYLLDRDSWDTASAVGVRYISGSPAAYFKGSFVIGAGGRRQSTRQVMADFARSGNFLRGWRGNNQMCVRMLDRDRSNFIGGRVTITDRLNILSQPRFAPTPMKEWLCNDLTYQFRENYREDNRGAWWAFGSHGNAPSLLQYGLNAMAETYPMVADTATAETVAQQRIDLLSEVPQVWTWAESLCGLTHDMLDGIAITQYGGKSGEGFIDNAMWIIKQTIDPKNSKVIYQAIDVERLMGGT